MLSVDLHFYLIIGYETDMIVTHSRGSLLVWPRHSAQVAHNLLRAWGSGDKEAYLSY